MRDSEISAGPLSAVLSLLDLTKSLGFSIPKERFPGLKRVLWWTSTLQTVIGIGAALYTIVHALRTPVNDDNKYRTKMKFLKSMGMDTEEMRGCNVSKFIDQMFLYEYLLMHEGFIECHRLVVNTYKAVDRGKVLAELASTGKFVTLGLTVVVRINGAKCAISMDSSTVVSFAYEEFAAEHVADSIASDIMASFSGAQIQLSSTMYDNAINVSVYASEVPKYYDKALYTELSGVIKTALDSDTKVGILLYGPPGASKTSTILKVVSELSALTFVMNTTEYAKCRSLLAPITKAKILLIEDMDTKENASKSETMAELLALLDSSCYNVFIGSVNSGDLEPALLRSGRCDVKRYCGLPTTKQRSLALKDIMANYKLLCADTKLAKLVVDTEGLSYADLESLVKSSFLNKLEVTTYLPYFLEKLERWEAHLAASKKVDASDPCDCGDCEECISRETGEACMSLKLESDDRKLSHSRPVREGFSR